MDTKELLNLPVKYIMSDKLNTVLPDTPVEQVYRIFGNMNIHHVPVVDKAGKLLGLISKSDVLILMDWRTKFKIDRGEKMNDFILKTNLASDVMNTKLVTIKPETTVRRCVDIFKENFFHCLPVEDNNHKLIGLVTTYDLMIAAYYDIPIIQ